MRLFLYYSLLSLLGCNQNSAVLPDATSTTIDVRNQPGWDTERLDDDYVIQFPNSYKGGIGPTIEGPEFSLRREDQRVYFLASRILTGGYFPLANPRPDSIQYTNLSLNRTVAFQHNGQTQGLFYYSRQPKSQGQLYLLRNGQLVFSMTVQYDADLYQEVLGILQTIQPR